MGNKKRPAKARQKTKYTRRADGRIVRTETIDGKRVYFYGRTDEEVDAKYAAYITPPARTLADIAADWWEKKEPELSVNTVRGYQCAKNRIVEDFGKRPCSDISAREIVAFLQKFAAQGYSQKVISNTRCVFKLIMDDAFIQGEVDRNPAVGLPYVKGKPKEMRQPATLEDRKRIEQHCGDSLIGAMWYFMLLTGARKGEAVALQHKHIDRKRKTATICQSCAWDGPKPVLKEPKTEAGIRTVLLPDKLLKVLPRSTDPNGFVFFPDGLPNRVPLDKAMKAFQTENGIEATAHQLRHSYASILHSARVDVKDAQALLGHSTIAMTQDIYTHLESDHLEDVRKQLNDYLSQTVVKTVVKNRSKP